MEKGARRDLRITGSMSAAGGIYGQVRITGEGRIDGALDCVDLECTGTCSVSGNVRAREMHVRGVVAVRGNLHSGQMKVYGQTSVDGEMAVKQAQIDGMARIGGRLSAEEVKVSGFLQADGDCEAEIFFAKGTFLIHGLLNAGNIEMRLHGFCEAKEIGGDRIRVRRPWPLRYLDVLFKSASHSRLAAEVIEGDEIMLENTRAQVVRGNHVTVGPGCEIGLVEYKGGFHQAKGSLVKDSKRI